MSYLTTRYNAKDYTQLVGIPKYLLISKPNKELDLLKLITTEKSIEKAKKHNHLILIG